MKTSLQEIKNDIYLVWKYNTNTEQSNALKEIAGKIDKLDKQNILEILRDYTPKNWQNTMLCDELINKLSKELTK